MRQSLRVLFQYDGDRGPTDGLGWRLWALATRRAVRYAAAWLLAVGSAAGVLVFAGWAGFRDTTRGDGNSGHTVIDFGGQWMMGRMLVSGHARDLYNRTAAWQVAWDAYPTADSNPLSPPEPGQPVPPDAVRSSQDAARVVWAYMGDEDPQSIHALAACAGLAALNDPWQAAAAALAAPPDQAKRLAELNERRVGGPLYPPIQAFAFAPFGLLRPQQAYYLYQGVLLAVTFVAGLAVSSLTRGRIWWPVATTLLLFYPGFRACLQLGQNGPVTLAIVLAGWALAARDRPYWGGVVWGLLAYKPVWGMAFALVPLLTGRWRMLVTMTLTGFALAAATLPVVGVQTWLDWLTVGKLASDLYNVDQNWIFLGRDLLSIPRRFLIDFSLPEKDRDNPAASITGWALLLIVLVGVVVFALRHRRALRSPTGPGPGFLFLGAGLCCYHYMYYDILLSAAGVVLLLDPPARFLKPTFVAVGTNLTDALRDYYRPRQARSDPLLTTDRRGSVWVASSVTLTLLAGLFVIEHTFNWLSLTAYLTSPVIPRSTRVELEGPIKLSQPEPIETTAKATVRTGFMLTTNTYGPPWDTFVLLGLLVWTGVRVARGNGEWGMGNGE
jgi:hypothetical protein